MGGWTRAFLSGLVLALVAAAGGCASQTAPAATDWSRSYVRAYSRVWQAAVATLKESGYFIEKQDEGRGYIRAESGEREAYRRVVLELFVVSRSESVRVDVQASGGAVSSPMDLHRLSRPVLAFLDDLDAKLRS